MDKRSWKLSCCFFILSVMIFLYVLFILEPFLVRVEFWRMTAIPGAAMRYLYRFSPAPTTLSLVQYFFMSALILVGYSIFTFKNLKRLHLTSLVYPISVFNLFFVLDYSFNIYLGDSLTTVLSWRAGIIVIFSILAVSLILGAISDIVYFRNNKRT